MEMNKINYLDENQKLVIVFANIPIVKENEIEDYKLMLKMNKIKISENKTTVLNKKDTFIRSILVGLRQKIKTSMGKQVVENPRPVKPFAQ